MKKQIFFLTVSALALSLTACESPPIQNKTDMSTTKIVSMEKAAAVSTEPNVVEVLRPKIIPAKGTVKKSNVPSLSGQPAVHWADKNSERQPDSKKFSQSIMQYEYKPGGLYVVYAEPLNITDVTFEVGETVTSVAAGDTLRWQVVKTYSGSGATLQDHLLLKPVAANLETSLVVTTNVHTYHLLLHSTTSTYMSAVSWHYPEKAEAEKQHHFQQTTRVDDNYQLQLLSGDKPTWMPTRVFNNGKKTYIELPKNRQSSPLLFVGSSPDSDMIVNYRSVDNFYVIDQIPKAMQLRLGNNPVTVVQITRGASHDK